MLGSLLDLARPLLFTLDGERAHEITIRSMRAGIFPRCSNDVNSALQMTLWGLNFPNPIGIAAGFDKNANVPDAVLSMGFGFTEVGTLTPKAQPGNPRPRVFRLIKEKGMINRLGFNNEGHEEAHQRLAARLKNDLPGPRGIVGVNIGANKDTEDRVDDYIQGLNIFNDVADYFMINISSPNTPGLRGLQEPDALRNLLKRIVTAREDLMSAGATRRPIIVKLSPDIAADELEEVIACLIHFKIDGIAISNTTLARSGLPKSAHQPTGPGLETGGLSGKPLFHRSTVMLARIFVLTKGRIPLIGIGGITTGETALAKIRAGASLLQLYTGLIYGGAGLIRDMQIQLASHVKTNGLGSITDATGADAEIWAARPLDE